MFMPLKPVMPPYPEVVLLNALLEKGHGHVLRARRLSFR